MEPGFGVWDYVVVGLMMVVSAGIGLYYRCSGGRQKSAQEYLLGDRDLPVLPVAISLMASFMSSITLLGVSRENYIFGTQFVVINVGYGLITPVITHCFLPVFFRLQLTSSYQYLEERFGQTTRLLTSVAFTLQMVLYLSIVLYAPAIALEALTGISTVFAILLVGLVCTFYSTIGGIKAVVFTDFFQSLLMFAAVFAVIIKGAMDAGGLKEIWRIAGEGGRLQFDNVSADPTQRHTWWSLMLGGGFTYLSLYAVNQIQVQRLLTLRSIQRSQVALWLSWPILSLISLSTSLAGLAIYSRYHDCDPVAAGRITSTDQLMPLFVVDSMGGLPGLCGVFVAGIFSGSLSTISSGVNSLAAVTLEDYIKPVYKRVKAREIPEKMNNIILKSFALAYGLVSVALAFSADYLGGLLQASLSILGVVGGPTLGMFTLGMFFTITNETGAVCGLLTGLSIAFWIAFGGPKPPVITLPISTEGCTNQPNVSDAGSSAELYRQSDTIFNTSVSQLVSNESSDSNYFYLYKLSYLWYVVIGFLMTVVVGLLVSAVCKMFRKTEPPAPNPDLFIPCVRSYILRQMAKKQLDGATKQYAAMDKLGPTAVSSESLKSGESAPL
ncbi:putative sodium-dependent multivitamin transporter isoform X7 [Bacillus rossius redtenbacheri]